jgi:hypothetical protein
MTIYAVPFVSVICQFVFSSALAIRLSLQGRSWAGHSKSAAGD